MTYRELADWINSLSDGQQNEEVCIEMPRTMELEECDWYTSVRGVYVDNIKAPIIEID